MERNLGICNEAFEFEEEVVQFVPIDRKTDAVIININNKLNHNEEDNKHRYQEDVNKDQIYIKQVIDGEDIYVNLPKDIVKSIRTDDLTEEVFTACGFSYNEDNLQQSNKQFYDDVHDDSYVSVDESIYKDFNYFSMYDYESVEINPGSRNKECAFIGNELDNFTVRFNEELISTKVSFTKSYEELPSIDSLHHYHNILPEYDVNKTKQVPGTHNFVANVDSRHNIDVNVIDQTNEGCYEFKLDTGDSKVVTVYTDIGNLTFDETDSVSEIMINDKTNSMAKSFNKTADEKSLISDDYSLKKYSDDSANCNGNYDEIKYRFKGPVFRSFCEKKKKKTWKRRSLGGELKLVLKV